MMRKPAFLKLLQRNKKRELLVEGAKGRKIPGQTEFSPDRNLGLRRFGVLALKAGKWLQTVGALGSSRVH